MNTYIIPYVFSDFINDDTKPRLKRIESPSLKEAFMELVEFIRKEDNQGNENHEPILYDIGVYGLPDDWFEETQFLKGNMDEEGEWIIGIDNVLKI